MVNVHVSRHSERTDTAANWTSVNPILARGEIGIEVDDSGNITGLKVGNGTDHWNDLGYWSAGGGTGDATTDDLTALHERTAVGTALLQADDDAAARDVIGAVADDDSRLSDDRNPTNGSVTVGKFSAATLVTAAETIASNDNDTTIPTCAAVRDEIAAQVSEGEFGGNMLASVYDPEEVEGDVFDRGNHTGTQEASTISDFSSAADARVPAATHAATSKSTPADSDEIPVSDSAASWAIKKFTWSNIKAALATYLASLTQTLTNKTMSGSSNTFSNISADSTIDGTANKVFTAAEKTKLGLAVVMVAAPTGTAATDTAAIQAAHDALPSGGGHIILQSGIYYLTATGVTFTKKVLLEGKGAMDPAAAAATTLYSASGTATAITISTNGKGSVIRNVAITNGVGSAATSGAGILLTRADYCHIDSVSVFGYYDNIDIVNGAAPKIRHCFIGSPARWGIRVRNVENIDSGDQTIFDCTFTCDGAYQNATAAVRWESAGGTRVSHCKIVNGATYTYVDGVDNAFQGDGTGSTMDQFIHNNSVENLTGVAFRFRRIAGSYLVQSSKVHDNEILSCAKGFEVGPGWNGLEIYNNTATNVTTGIHALSGSGLLVIGTNTWYSPGPTTVIQIDSGASHASKIAKQIINADTVVFTNGLSGLAGAPQIDCNYQRSINWTVDDTPHTLWELGAANYSSGKVTLSAWGVVNGVGGGYVEREFLYLVNGSGVVTITDMTEPLDPPSVEHGADITLTVSTSTNKMVLALSTPNDAEMYDGIAELDVKGRLSSLRRGAA